MTKKFNFDPLPSIKKEEQKQESVEQVKKESVSSKITFSIEEELKDKMQDFAYWKGYTQQDVILLALEEYLKNNQIPGFYMMPWPYNCRIDLKNHCLKNGRNRPRTVQILCQFQMEQTKF